MIFDMRPLIEKRWLFLMFAGALCLAVYQWIISPFMTHEERLEAKLASAERSVAELADLGKRYLELQRETEVRGGQENGKEFNLLSYLQETAESLGLKTYIKSMRPSHKDIDPKFREESVSLELAKVPLETLIPYLYLLDTARERVWIAQVSCHPDAVEGMNLDMTVSAIVEK